MSVVHLLPIAVFEHKSSFEIVKQAREEPSIGNLKQAVGMRVFKNALNQKHKGISGISLGLLFRLMAARLQGSPSTTTSTMIHHISTQSDGPCTSKFS